MKASKFLNKSVVIILCFILVFAISSTSFAINYDSSAMPITMQFTQTDRAALSNGQTVERSVTYVTEDGEEIREVFATMQEGTVEAGTAYDPPVLSWIINQSIQSTVNGVWYEIAAIKYRGYTKGAYWYYEPQILSSTNNYSNVKRYVITARRDPFGQIVRNCKLQGYYTKGRAIRGSSAIWSVDGFGIPYVGYQWRELKGNI